MFNYQFDYKKLSIINIYNWILLVLINYNKLELYIKMIIIGKK